MVFWRVDEDPRIETSDSLNCISFSNIIFLIFSAIVTDTSGKCIEQDSDHMVRLTMQKWHTEHITSMFGCIMDSRSKDDAPKHRSDVYS